MSDKYASYLFHQGTNYTAYDFLGVHKLENGKYCFRVWAPNAHAVYVIGSFNNWDMSCPMARITEGGIWEAELSAAEGDMYKFRIINGDKTVDKADPYGFYCEKPPATASVIYDVEGFRWHDKGWLARRRKLMRDGGCYSQPLNIYEMHAGSWKLHEDGSYYTYRELAEELAPYVKQMGYTHIELMPIMEHPYVPSWGYQVCGYFAPTARFGEPKDFMAFVDKMHTAGIGVILDWVPAHFPKDAHGLYEFDGQPLYEYQGGDRIEHAGWGTRRFDVGREEVESFLVSNAAFWLDKYHIDGLRVDAVASMLYLDYDKMPDEWVPNVYGDNRCLEAIAFFQKLNRHVSGLFPDVLMIAEESGSFGNLTSFDEGGLGFTYKWNMGWMHDALDYAELDPLFRKHHHDKLTFSLMYAFSEKYVLPISHDEVVHGKKSLLDKMSGDYWQKFATARAFAVYMMTHPGKKLHFMGNEIGQFREWDEEGQIEWFLLDYDMHAKYQLFWAELNHLYLEHPELWEDDCGWDGFGWIEVSDADRSIYAYRRMDKDKNEVITVVNFTPVVRHGYILGVPEAGEYTELINSDSQRYGGSGVVNSGALRTSPEESHGLPHRLTLTLPPLGAVVLKLNNNSKSI